ncbi:MAG: hypothetical protein AB1696_25395 [Planctomycetota bacterium]
MRATKRGVQGIFLQGATRLTGPWSGGSLVDDAGAATWGRPYLITFGQHAAEELPP